MDTHELEIVGQSARRFLSKVCSPTALASSEQDPRWIDLDAWSEMAALGWLGVLSQPDRTDAIQHLVTISQELGRVLCPAPFVAVAVAANSTLTRLDTDLAQMLSQAVAGGERRPVLAVSEGNRTWHGKTSNTQWQEGRVNGRKQFVESGMLADMFLVTARDRSGQPMTVLVDAAAPGVTVTPVSTMAGFPWAHVEFDDAPGEPLEKGWEAVDASLSDIAAVCAGWCSGAAAKLLEDTVDYVSHRRQFGAPLGSFQAVQHRLADCDIAVTESGSMAEKAGRLIDAQSGDSKRISSAAFVRSTNGFVDIARHCHQVWGGMGYSTETNVHLFSRRAKRAQQSWGGTAMHSDIVAHETAAMPLLRDRYASRFCVGGMRH